MDWPAAENHFTFGLGRLTRIDTGDPRHVRLTDDRSSTIPGSMRHRQAGGAHRCGDARLREYLLRGGFLVVDDFWGPEQWDVFRQTMNRVFPGRPIRNRAVGFGHACFL